MPKESEWPFWLQEFIINCNRFKCVAGCRREVSIDAKQITSAPADSGLLSDLA